MDRSNGHASDRRGVITGLGAVSAAGWGVAPLREALRSGLTAIGPFDRFDHARQRTHLAGQVPPQPSPSVGAVCSPRWNRLSNSERFALFSACEALTQAGLSPASEELQAGVFFASSTGGLVESERYFEQVLTRPDSNPPRAWLASHLLSTPAETVARHLRVQGPVETVSSACASGGLVIEQAVRAIRASEIDVALAGGSDCLCLTTYSGFNALRAVSETPCRPFRPDRAGI